MDASAVAFDLDTQLMLSAKQNDDHSFGLLVERHRTSLVHYLIRLVRNPAVAEELAQDVFLRVHRSRESWEPSAKFTTWLFRISTNVAYNYFRDQRYHNRNLSLEGDVSVTFQHQIPDGTDSTEAALVRNVRYQQVQEAIARLPWKQRSAVVMHKYEEMDYAAIAQVFGCTPSAVKALMFRAYENLRSQLASLAD